MSKLQRGLQRGQGRAGLEYPGCSVELRTQPMARYGIERLHVKNLRATKPGLLSDGGNLNLRIAVGKDGDVSRGWIFRFQLPGQKTRYMGLGSLDSVGLAKARELAKQYREMIATGVDPIDHRNAQRAQTVVNRVPTFDEVAAAYTTAHGQAGAV